MIHFCKLLDAATGQLDRHLDPAEVSTLRQERQKVVWLDVLDPTEADMEVLAEEFGFHPLALEDCLHSHQRPKLEQYQGYVFMVLYQPHLVADDIVVPLELEVFLGPNYVVTVHRQPVPVIPEIERRWEVGETPPEEGASYLFYLLVDAVVDSYFPVLDAYSDRLEALERRIFESFQPEVLEDIFKLKKETLHIRRLVTPLRDVFLVLLRGQHTVFGAKTYPLFQDVLDHLLRISDGIDTYRELVGSALDAYMSSASNRTNETMKKLTVLSTVLMSMALVAGIYGMNFRVMPELAWQDGYYFALWLMAGVAAVLTALFRWRRYI